MMSSADIAIVGGGVAGCAAAIALARAGCSVVVLERTEYERTRIGETLPPRARQVLEELGVWQDFRRDAHLPAAGSLAAWGSADLYENQFLFNPYGSGWHLDRRKFESRFAQWAEGAGARVLRNVRVRNIRALSGPGWSLDMERGGERTSIECAAVIDASGHASFLARRLGAERLASDALVGVYAFFGAATDLNDARTMVEAAPSGWWYSAYLPNARLIAAFMSDRDLLPRGASPLQAFWRRQLDATTYTRARVHGARLDGEVRTIRANSYCMSKLAGKNWLAVGDAASAFDPLSSHGLYNAMRSAIEAASALQRAVAGDGTALSRYAAWTRERFARFLAARAVYYGREIRWPDSPFWQRRHAGKRSREQS